jgi:SAM-dependent methyltransferase
MEPAPARDAIEAHYDRFPYPPIQRIVQAGSPVHSAGILSYLLRRRAHEAFTVRPSIWVAGCGTQQGTTWAFSFPASDVLATDVSDVTLQVASALAAELGASNVRFARHDLRDPPPGNAFELIICMGVVHHLPAPVEALRRLREALAPHGAASIKVYSRVHRAPFEPVRRAALALSQNHADPYAVACKVLDAVLHGRGQPHAREVMEYLWSVRETQPSFVADVLLNPREQSYDVDELMALLADAGLRFVEWLHPGAWELSAYVDDPAILSWAKDLGPLGEAAFLQRVTGMSSPALEVLVERDDAPERPPYTPDERCAMPMLCSPGARELDITGGKLRGERAMPPFTVQDGTIGGTTRSSSSAVPRPWSVTDGVLPLLRAFDGTRTVTEVGRMWAPSVHPEVILSMVDTLGPRVVGLLAPAWARAAT